MSKSTDKARRRSAATIALIASGGQLGYNSRFAFRTAVETARKLVPSDYLKRSDEQRKAFDSVVRDFGEQYKAGNVVAYLEPFYGKRWGNLSQSQRIESAIEILAKPEPTSDKSNRRTELEHKAARAAISAWSHLKGEAGLKKQTESKTNRKGASKRRAAGDEKPVPAARLTAPHFVAPVDALAFYSNLSTDLLRAVNANALATPIAIKSAVQDFRKALAAAIAEAKAGAKRTAKAKAAKDTVSIGAVASRMQNPRPGNGAAVN